MYIIAITINWHTFANQSVRAQQQQQQKKEDSMRSNVDNAWMAGVGGDGSGDGAAPTKIYNNFLMSET